ncbi:MAG: acetyl-CoA decarbonylase/synthase complex subunit gamma [Methanophagales archaeon]|nr:acetyl-CoA decarbonylase/synthase complex subunit gamma [Methanophagales archaeon]
MKVRSPMVIWKYLPQKNCGECGEKTCSAFSLLLKGKKKRLEECTPLFNEDEYADKRKQLKELLAPAIREVEIGVGARACKIGGEEVMHRHELTFFNRVALVYDVWDTMDEAGLRERVRRITNWKKFYIGDFLRVDAIAVRSVAEDARTFAECVKMTAEETDLPLVLCSFDSEMLEEGLMVVADSNPLLYAADKTNWKSVLRLAMDYNVPVTISSSDLDTLSSLAATFSSAGVKDIVLNPEPGTNSRDDEFALADTFSKLIRIRRAGIVDENKVVAYPLMSMSIPRTAREAGLEEVNAGEGGNALDASYREAIHATMSTIKYADIMILHSIEPHSLIAVRTLAANIYTDPRRPINVASGLRELGTPTEDSPLFLTVNFALTYYTVESDINSNKIDSYLLVVDTDGMGVEAAVAGGQLTAEAIKAAIESCSVGDKVKHKTIVIPGLAARLSGEIEDVTGWNVLVGPRDSGMIPGWMDNNWPPEVETDL